ncbi:hypothetical protein ACWCQN_38305 [Streptomyces sp. NPDC001984]
MIYAAVHAFADAGDAVGDVAQVALEFCTTLAALTLRRSRPIHDTRFASPNAASAWQPSP